ncbi:hypothetical protein [Methylobacillus glycogenes]|uniref:hypothetical protein n=1 Tax=Methylobacillus glycogenes TaxID=406 RepID=UPI0004723F41|nr:hypothetical protein [Methylobacillus glycogenes]
MEIIRPRITDYHGINKSQADLDFAIQFFDEDIPLYVDPFLLFKSPSQQDNALHGSITNSFNHLNYLIKKNKKDEAANILISISECGEVGLGLSKKRVGSRIGKVQANDILSLFENISEFSQFGFHHFEIIQLFISGISKDRISDISCNYLKSFLIDYTIDQCQTLGIPLSKVFLENYYDPKTYSIKKIEVNLPINPITKLPLIFTPKRWLRYTPWLNYDDYFKSYCPKDEIFNKDDPEDRSKVLMFNRENYGVVENYVREKLRHSEDCANDPLFTQIPVISAKRKFNEILKLPTGKEDGADWKYEDLATELLSSMFYPSLDFAAAQSRTESNRHIRDLIFYNNRDIDFLQDIHQEFGNSQLVVEMKNVKEIDRDHINQLNRYLQGGIGNFGVFLTRNPLKRAMYQNTIDLWSSQRKCIIALTDDDLRLMVDIFESKQRSPIDVLKKKFIEFRRHCPS